MLSRISPIQRISNRVQYSRFRSIQKRWSSELDAAQGRRERIVILGSGWAGFNLAKSLDRKKFQVVIVSPRSYFVFTPLLASTSVGTLEFRTALEPIREKSETYYIQGWADTIDFGERRLVIEEFVSDPRQTVAPIESKYEGKSLEQVKQEMEVNKEKGKVFGLNYDKLVIAVGCYTQTFGTPGVKEHANFLKDVGDATKIRKRVLECFETAALPTTPESVKKQLLHFITVGGGPTGIEFSAELHDLIKGDLAKLYPTLAKYPRITVYDIAPGILTAFDDQLAKYAADTFRREGIEIRTSKVIQKVRAGLSQERSSDWGGSAGLTVEIKEEESQGAGMVVWSTGLMRNPFVNHILELERTLPSTEALFEEDPAKDLQCRVRGDQKTGNLLTNDRLRLVLQASSSNGETKEAFANNIFALGDCAIVKGTNYPATAQVASQKAYWLAKRLNKGDLESNRFQWKNMGIMAYLGSEKAILQGGEGTGIGNISGRFAWLIWRGVYLSKAVSWRNRIFIPIYWFLTWAFGRDVSRF